MFIATYRNMFAENNPLVRCMRGTEEGCLPWTQVAPTASSTLSQMRSGAVMLPSHEPTIPMTTDSGIVTTAHPALKRGKLLFGKSQSE